MVLMNQLLISFLVTAAFADSIGSENGSSRLMIHIPHSLYRDDGYEHREALFGMPPYGGSISQTVYYADATLCDADVDTSRGYPERERDANGRMKPWASPFILMVDRGDCTFVQKVRNAQRAGAAGVIIADQTCLCTDDACMRKTASQTCEATEPIMADDGSGGDISIPSFLMFKHDADAVKAELKENRPVQIEMAWSLPNPDDRVEYDLWTVPGDTVSREFLRNWKKVAQALGKRAYFTPHMYIHDGIKAHCQGSDGTNFCYTLCTNQGRYCSTDPDNDLDKGISGADVVKESLRRICIWQAEGANDGIGAKFWDYLAEFNARCNSEDFFSNEDCVKDAFKRAKIDFKNIEKCMSESGGLSADKPNTKLDSEIALQSQRGVVVVPSAFVNNAVIRGSLSVSNIFMAVCSGYADGSMPKVCQQCAGCSDVPGCVDAGYCKAISNGKGAPQGGVSTHTFATSLILVIGLFSGLAAWHYKRTREEMRDQVRGILAEYMPLEDQDTVGMNGGAMSFARSAQSTSLIS